MECLIQVGMSFVIGTAFGMFVTLARFSKKLFSGPRPKGIRQRLKEKLSREKIVILWKPEEYNTHKELLDRGFDLGKTVAIPSNYKKTMFYQPYPKKKLLKLKLALRPLIRSGMFLGGFFAVIAVFHCFHIGS